jgi:hypothetical protein
MATNGFRVGWADSLIGYTDMSDKALSKPVRCRLFDNKVVGHVGRYFLEKKPEAND